MKLPNGVFTEYQYNAMNRLTEVVNLQTQPQNGQPLPITLSRFGYSHYADGQRATAGEKQKHADPNMVVMANSRGFRYDGLHRLTYESNYDDGWPHYGFQAKYVYDLAGNRAERRVEVKNSTDTTTLTTQYAYYTGTDRLQTETNVNNLPFTAIPWGQDRVYAYASPDGSLSYGLLDSANPPANLQSRVGHGQDLRRRNAGISHSHLTLFLCVSIATGVIWVPVQSGRDSRWQDRGCQRRPGGTAYPGYFTRVWFWAALLPRCGVLGQKGPHRIIKYASGPF